MSVTGSPYPGGSSKTDRARSAESLQRTTEGVKRLKSAVDDRDSWLERMKNDKKSQMTFLSKKNDKLTSELEKLRQELLENAAITSKYEEEILALREIIKGHASVGEESKEQGDYIALRAGTDRSVQCLLLYHSPSPLAESECTQSIIHSSVVSYNPSRSPSAESGALERRPEESEANLELIGIGLVGKQGAGMRSPTTDLEDDMKRLEDLTKEQDDTVGEMGDNLNETVAALNKSHSEVAALKNDLGECIDIAEGVLCEAEVLTEVVDKLSGANGAQQSEIEALEQRLAESERNLELAEKELADSKAINVKSHVDHVEQLKACKEESERNDIEELKRSDDLCEKSASLQRALEIDLKGTALMEEEIVKCQQQFDKICDGMKLENSSLTVSINKSQSEVAALKEKLQALTGDKNDNDTPVALVPTASNNILEILPTISLPPLDNGSAVAQIVEDQPPSMLSADNVSEGSKSGKHRGFFQVLGVGIDTFMEKVDDGVGLEMLRRLLHKIVSDVIDDGHIAPLVLAGLTLSALVARGD